VETSLGIVVYVFKEVTGLVHGIFKTLARYAIPLFKQGAKIVGKRALKAATEVGQDVLQGRNVRESAKTHGKTLPNKKQRPYYSYIRQGAEAREGKANVYSNLSATKRLKLRSHIAVPRRTKWITEDGSNHDDESSHVDESDSNTFQASDDIY
jgi:hypothetical protein